MKKTLLLPLLLISASIFGQIEGKTVTEVFDVESKNASEIYSILNKWVALNYNSANNVVQMNDKESGTMIVKGVSTIPMKNAMKIVYPKNKYIQEVIPVKIYHTLEFNTKDNKYRLKYTYTKLDESLTSNPYSILNRNFWRSLNLKEKAELSEDYKQSINKLFKGSMVGKKKRAKLIQAIEENVTNLQIAMLANIGVVFSSIKNEFDKKNKEDW